MLDVRLLAISALLTVACERVDSGEPWNPAMSTTTGDAAVTGSEATSQGDGAAEEVTTGLTATRGADGLDDAGAESGAGPSGTTSPVPDGPQVGPDSGVLLVHGGGSFGPGFTHFLELAGGTDAAIVVVPTSMPDGSFEVDNPSGYEASLASNWGLSNVTVLHTRDPSVADSPAFAAPLTTADAVWFGGGRQWRFVDAYADTVTEEEFRRVLQRGGVIGGSSAGASIQSSFLVRGDTAGNAAVIGDHTVGFGYLRGVGIDQHVGERGREYDLFEVLEHDASLLGLGLDEATWIVVEQDAFECFGSGSIYVHDVANWAGAANDDEKIRWLTAGDRYDMANRQQLP